MHFVLKGNIEREMCNKLPPPGIAQTRGQLDMKY